MSNTFQVGKQYELVDVSKGDGQLEYVLDEGLLILPEDKIITCHALDDGHCLSHTEGVEWHHPLSKGEADILTATAPDLEAGVWVEVTDAC